MSVYVDRMGHMVADTTEELEQMARRLRLKPAWRQRPGTPHEHYDLFGGKRAAALALGAIEIGWREMARKTMARHGDAPGREG